MDRSRVISCPRPGWFRVRKHRTVQGQRAVWIPARISEILPLDPLTGEVLERSPMLEAFIGDTPVATERVWLHGYEISREEHRWLVAITALRE